MARIKTPFDKTPRRSSGGSVVINLLIVLIIILLGVAGRLSYPQLTTYFNGASSSAMTTPVGAVGELVTLEGTLVITGDVSDPVFQLITPQGTTLLISSTTVLSKYEGTIQVVGTVMTPVDGMPVVDVAQVLLGNMVDTMTTTGDDTAIMTGEDLIDTGSELTGTVAIETGTIEPKPADTDTTPVTSRESDLLSEPAGVTQFRINTGKSLTYSTNRGFSVVFPTMNIAYSSLNVGTGLEAGSTLRCGVQTDVIVYANRDVVNEQPSVSIFECSPRKNFNPDTLSAYRVVKMDELNKLFVIKVNDPSWTRFANNVVVTTGTGDDAE